MCARATRLTRTHAVSLAILVLSASACSEADSPTGISEIDGHASSHGTYHIPQADRTVVDGKEVVLIGFENDSLDDDVAFTIDPFTDVEGATFGTADYDSVWRACPGRSGCAAFENPPSPTRGATINGVGYAAVVRFDPPVSSVSFLYTAYITNDHTLYAYNSAGHVIASAFAPGNDETTNEEPFHNTWDTVSVEVDSDLIRRIVYSGVGVPALDDLTFTRKASCDDIFAQPTGDPILDRPEVQTALYDALVEGGAFSPDIEARLEEGGWIFERPDGTTYARLTENPAAQSACGLIPGGAFPDNPEDTAIAGYHSHPFSDGDLLPSSSCDLDKPHTYDAFSHGGPSGPDWEGIIKDSGIPHFVIDLDNVYAVQEYVPPSQRASTPAHKWTDSACSS